MANLISTCLLAVAVAVLLQIGTAAGSTCSRLSLEQKQAILDSHNLLRADTARGHTASQPSSCNMMLMEWDDRLEEKAHHWASQCTFRHDTSAERLIPGYRAVGQNMALGYERNFSRPVVRWYDEYPDYTYSSLSCAAGKACGHYTQDVWANSVRIGCGVCLCDGSYISVCNYAPAGNYIGERPYVAGSPATCCMGDYTYDMGGVCASKQHCDRSGLSCRCTLGSDSCQNGGVFDSANCRCNCPDGFYGVNCEKACQNHSPAWDYTCDNGANGDNSEAFCSSIYGDYCMRSCGLCHTKSYADPDALNVDDVIPRVIGVE